MDLPSDFKDLLAEFASEAVEFIVVGGYAVAFHGRPRATKDIDVLLEGSSENLAKAARALVRFGAPPNVVSAVAVMEASDVVFMGQAPLRIDLLRSIDGVDAADLFRDALLAELDGLHLKFISLDHLIANKVAAGRPQDLIDADYLKKVRARLA